MLINKYRTFSKKKKKDTQLSYFGKITFWKPIQTEEQRQPACSLDLLLAFPPLESGTEVCFCKAPF